MENLIDIIKAQGVENLANSDNEFIKALATYKTRRSPEEAAADLEMWKEFADKHLEFPEPMPESERDRLYKSGKQLLQQGFYEKAKDCFYILHRQSPFDPSYMKGCAVSFQMLRQFEPAINIFENLCKMGESNKAFEDLGILFNLGQCYLAVNNKEKSKETFEKFLEFAKNKEPLAESCQQARKYIATLTVQ